MDGIIIVNKPSGITSRDVVNHFSKRLGSRKIGHTGTLDPLAEGVLVLCVNKGTKLVELLTDHEKDYTATVQLGVLTDTLDITGKVLKEEKIVVDKEKLINTLKSFNKEYEQEVPIYSAVKIDGKKLYEYARDHIDVVLPKRTVKVSNVDLVAFDGDTFTFNAHVSKGTYIRALIRDICKELGVSGTMSKLVRTSLGDYHINDAIGMDDDIKIISIDEVLNKYKTIDMNEELEKKISNGVPYECDFEEPYLYFRYNGMPEALYRLEKDHKYHMYQFFK